MSALDDIRASLKTAIETVSGLKGYARAPGEVVAPAGVVLPSSSEFSVDFDGDANYLLTVQVLVPLGEWERAQEVMDGYVSHDGTLVAAIHDSADLEARVVGFEQYGVTAWGLTEYLGAQLTVQVLV